MAAQLDHVLLPCKMTSSRIPRKNLQRVGGVSLLERAIRQWMAWYPEAAVWVATDDLEAISIAKRFCCRVYPISDSDRNDTRNVGELFTEFLSGRSRYERCCYHQVTSPFTFRSEVQQALDDPRPFCRSAWIGKVFCNPRESETKLLTQSLGESVILTGNFGFAWGQHVVTLQDAALRVSPVSWLSAIDIDTSSELELADRIAASIPLERFG